MITPALLCVISMDLLGLLRHVLCEDPSWGPGRKARAQVLHLSRAELGLTPPALLDLHLYLCFFLAFGALPLGSPLLIGPYVTLEALGRPLGYRP